MTLTKTVVQDTPEKFRPLAEEIIPPLLELLEARNTLEREICARAMKLREEQAAAGLPPNQTTPAEEDLYEEYRCRYLELVRPRCTETLLKWGAAGSWGKPAKYDYLFGSPEPTVFFTMRSAKKAVVSTRNPVSYDYRYRFILRPSEDGWLVDGVECAFGNSESWGSERTL